MQKAATLPDEIIREVLLKLPVKSLCRFKCVSNPWLLLISDPELCKTHYSNRTPASSMPMFFICTEFFSVVSGKSIVLEDRCFSSEEDDTRDCECLFNFDCDNFVSELTLKEGDCGNEFFDVEDRDNYDCHGDARESNVYDCIRDDADAVLGIHISSMSLESRYNIVGSCHGLVCAMQEKSNKFFVFNPVTRTCKGLPGPSHCSANPPVDCDRRDFYGFGHDSSSEDYKVLVIVLYEDDYGYRSSPVIVGSLRNNTWKTACDSPYEFIGEMGTYACGSLHWITSDLNVVAFDLAVDEFRDVPLFRKSIQVVVEALGEHNGCLCLLEAEYENSCLVMWTMLEYGARGSWTKLMAFPEILSGISTFYSINVEGDKFIFIKGNHLIKYSFEEHTFVLLRIRNIRYSACFQVTKYEESFISPFA